MFVYSDDLGTKGQELYTYAIKFNPPDSSLIVQAMAWCHDRFGPDGISRTDELALLWINADNWTCINRVFYFNDLLEAVVFKLRWGLEKEEPHKRRIL